MLIEITLLIIALIWLSFATYFDIKTQEIPDWLSYSLIIIAIVLKLLHSITTNEWGFFYQGLIAGTVFFGIGSLMYYTKQWGGGDAKLLAGLAIAFTAYPKFLLNSLNPNLNFPFLLILFLNILIVGALYGIIWAFVLAIKDRKHFSLNLKKILHMKKVRLLEVIVFILTLVLLLIAFFTVQDLKIKLLALFVGILPLFFLYLLILVKSIENMSFIKKIPVSKIRIEDQIQNDIFYKGKKIYSKKSLGVTKEQLILIKKAKTKFVIIKEGIPFVPSFLIGVLISLIFGNLIYF